MNRDKLKWYINRLKQMNLAEVAWRISQKSIEKYEKVKLKALPLDSVIYKDLEFDKTVEYKNYKVFFKGYEDLLKTEISKLDKTNKAEVISNVDRLKPLKDSHKSCNKTAIIPINWHDCVDTDQNWPKIFSLELSYKQNDAYGDARKNWEINRHFLFQKLAYDYSVYEDQASLEILEFHIKDWIKENPFLIGISYTSVMEVAIRGFSWFVAYDLIFQRLKAENDLLKTMRRSILNMATYVANHYSRYSSANNHLLVELVFLGIIGKAFKINKWLDLSMNILPGEMDRQNYSDGVNKEMSIHYQSFVMEAIGLYLVYLRDDNHYRFQIDRLKVHLNEMGKFLSHLMDISNHIPELGDNDEGKLFDVDNAPMNHYLYVLELISGLTEYSFVVNNAYKKKLKLLYNSSEIYSIIDNALYDNTKSKVFKEGGYTILKNHIDDCHETQVIMDHGDLGFGSICAHGQADALSITLTVDGIPVLVDPGTYIYHSQLKWRDYFRKTINHNTVEVNGQDQSEMLGPFLWGKRGEAMCIDFSSNEEMDYISAKHTGYYPIKHIRSLELHKSHDIIVLRDNIDSRGSLIEATSSFIFDERIIVVRESKQVVKVIGIGSLGEGTKQYNEQIEIFFECEEVFEWIIEDGWISKTYGKKIKTKVLRLKTSVLGQREIKVIIRIIRKRK